MAAPLSINLNAEAATGVAESWRTFLQSSIGAAVKPSDQQLRLRLNSSNEVFTAAVDLAQKEKARHGAVDFCIEVHAEACWLVITAPADAPGVIAELAALLKVDLGRGARAD